MTTNVDDRECVKDDTINFDEYLDCSKVLFENRLKYGIVTQSKFDDFILHKTIGMGSFGRVILVNHKSDNNTFLAMKVS